MKRVIIVALQQYLNNGHEPRQAGALCKNWRQVRELLRNDYKDCEVTIFRQKWSLPYKDFWVKSARKEVAIYLKGFKK